MRKFLISIFCVLVSSVVSAKGYEEVNDTTLSKVYVNCPGRLVFVKSDTVSVNVFGESIEKCNSVRYRFKDDNLYIDHIGDGLNDKNLRIVITKPGELPEIHCGRGYEIIHNKRRKVS